MTQVLLRETRQLEVGLIHVWTLNRPQVLNAINSEVIQSLDEATKDLEQQLKANPLAARALILQGAESKAFAAGADVAEMKNLNASEAEAFSLRGQTAMGRLESLSIPTIAAINGFTLGGGLELALCCDLLVATPESQFGQPEAHLGLIPGFGATARLPLRIGVARTLDWLYTGRRCSAEEAFQWGLVQRIARERSALEESFLLANEMKKSSPLALSRIKQLVLSQTQEQREVALKNEACQFGSLFETSDQKEGIQAFLEKRKATFSGK